MSNPKRPLAAGDRVSGDWFSPRAEKYIRVRGLFKRFGEQGALVEIQDTPGEYWNCAPNSLRRIIQKPRRRIWIPEYVIEQVAQDITAVQRTNISLRQIDYNDIEFVEVRRKKIGT